MRILVLDDDPIVLSAIQHQTSITYEKHEFCFCESFDEYTMNYKDCLFDVLLFDFSSSKKRNRAGYTNDSRKPAG